MLIGGFMLALFQHHFESVSQLMKLKQIAIDNRNIVN